MNVQQDALAVVRLMSQGRRFEDALRSTCPPYLGKRYRDKVKSHMFSEGYIELDRSSMYWGVTGKGLEDAGL